MGNIFLTAINCLTLADKFSDINTHGDELTKHFFLCTVITCIGWSHSLWTPSPSVTTPYLGRCGPQWKGAGSLEHTPSE